MYRCLKENSFEDGSGYQLVSIRPEDSELIRQWRNAQIGVLRQSREITAAEQNAYFQKVILPSFQLEKPDQILFSFLCSEQCIGYGGLTHIDWQNSRAELSFLLEPNRAQDHFLYQRDFEHFLKLLYKIAFHKLQLHRLVAETYAFRDETINLLEQLGFKREGILREHVWKQNAWTHSVMLGLLETEAVDTNRSAEAGILLTSISKKIPLINAVRKAMHQMGWKGYIHGADSASECVGKYDVDCFWHCPPLEVTSPLEVLRYCRENHIVAIIPTRDADLEFYAKHCTAFQQEGVDMMVSPYEAVETCLDKKAFSDVLLASHYPAISVACSLAEVQFPSYVVKERRGAGSRNVGLNLNREKALEHSLRLKDPIFQPYIEGAEWSVDLYRSKSGKVLGCVARERNLIVDGESQITTTRRNLDLENLCERMAGTLNLYGHAVFQILESKSGAFHVIECNPRFGGASTASLAVGLNSFVWFFIECSHGDLEKYPFQRATEEIRQVRVPCDRIIRYGDHE